MIKMAAMMGQKIVNRTISYADRVGDSFLPILLLLHFVSFVGEISGAHDHKINESDNTEAEEERVSLKISNLN